MKSQARIATLSPARYLGQLCKHFQHKIPVTIEERTGRITFAAGVCDLEAETGAQAGTLVLTCEAADAENLARVEDVVARHLLRFAFREPPAIVWLPQSDGAVQSVK